MGCRWGGGIGIEEGPRILIAPMLAQDRWTLGRGRLGIQAGDCLQGLAEPASRVQGHVPGHADAIPQVAQGRG